MPGAFRAGLLCNFVGGLPSLTWQTALTTWSASPVLDALAVLAVVGYVAMLRRLSARGQRWPVGAVVCFVTGVLVLLVSVNGSIEGWRAAETSSTSGSSSSDTGIGRCA